MAGQQIDHHARMGRVEMLDQDESHAGAGRQRGEQLAESLEAAGRGAEPDDRETVSREQRATPLRRTPASPRASRSGRSRILPSHIDARSVGIACRYSSGTDMRYIQALQRAEITLPPVLIVSRSRALSVMYITEQVWARFFRMFLEDEKRCAPGPTDSIHKMPPRGPADQVLRLAAGRAQSNRHVPSSGQHW